MEFKTSSRMPTSSCSSPHGSTLSGCCRSVASLGVPHCGEEWIFAGHFDECLVGVERHWWFEPVGSVATDDFPSSVVDEDVMVAAEEYAVVGQKYQRLISLIYSNKPTDRKRQLRNVGRPFWRDSRRRRRRRVGTRTVPSPLTRRITKQHVSPQTKGSRRVLLSITAYRYLHLHNA
jgi:hypothetical protein